MGIKSYPSIEAALAVANAQAVGATENLQRALRLMEFAPTQADAVCFDGAAESVRGRWRPVLKLRVKGLEWSPWGGTADDAETFCRALRFIGYEGPHWPAWRLREMLAEAEEREGRRGRGEGGAPEVTAKPLLADVGPVLDDVWREIRAAPMIGCAVDVGRVSTLRRIADQLERAVTDRIWEELAKEDGR